MVKEQNLTITYRYAEHFGSERTRRTVWLTRTPCHFGGERVWFCCPTCERRTSSISRQNGIDVQVALPSLSIYRGHVKVTDTYWYVTAIPDLMNAVSERFERFVYGAGKEQQNVRQNDRAHRRFSRVSLSDTSASTLSSSETQVGWSEQREGTEMRDIWAKASYLAWYRGQARTLRSRHVERLRLAAPPAWPIGNGGKRRNRRLGSSGKLRIITPRSGLTQLRTCSARERSTIVC